MLHLNNTQDVARTSPSCLSGGPKAAKSPYHSSTMQGGSLFAMLEGGCHFRLGCLAVATSLAGSAGGTPSLEAACTEVKADVGVKAELGLMTRVRGVLQSSIFSNTRLGWEPVVERWSFSLQTDFVNEGG